MSRLDELIAELCPDGVPYVALSTVAEYAKERIDAAEIDADTYVGVDNLLPEKKGKTVSSYVPNEGRLISFHVGDILIGNIRPYLKKIWLADSDGGTNGDVLPIHIRDKNVEPKFLYYCLSSDQFFMYDMQHAKGAKMPRGRSPCTSVGGTTRNCPRAGQFHVPFSGAFSGAFSSQKAV